MRRSLISAAGVAWALLHALPAGAAMYKCTDARGKLAFQQQPCPKETQSERLALGAEWRLLDEQADAHYGSSKTYFDPEHIDRIDGYRRVAFKRLYTPGRSGRRYPDEVYYHYFQCESGQMSPRFNGRDERPGTPDQRWDPWQDRSGPYPNIRTVFQAACMTSP